MSDWLIGPELPSTDDVATSFERLSSGYHRTVSGPTYALRLHELSLRDSTWGAFIGGSDVRLDIVAMDGRTATRPIADSAFTVRVPDVRTRKTLPFGDGGLPLYLGDPAYFLTFAVIASRERTPVDDLPTLLRSAAGDSVRSDAEDDDHSTMQQTLMAAATGIGLVARTVKTRFDRSIGLIYQVRLEIPDRFGLGRNPASGVYSDGGLSLWYGVETVGGLGRSRVKETPLQMRTVVALDVVGYSSRAEPGADAIQQRLNRLIHNVLADAGLPLDSVDVQTMGDGANVVLPPEMDYSSLVPVILSLDQRLKADNAVEPDRIRLRVALDLAMVRRSDMGFSGDAVIRAGRLLDSDPLRAAVTAHPSADIVVMFSDAVYRVVVQQRHDSIDPDRFMKTDVRVKDFVGIGWMLMMTE
jgi:hypothetical protein